MKHLLLILLFLNIIPAPKECEEYNGTFHSNNKILSYSIISSDISNEELNDFDCYLKSIGYNKAKKNPDIYISIGKRFFKGSLPYSANELEGYRLNVQEHRIIKNLLLQLQEAFPLKRHVLLLFHNIHQQY